jgi:membrane-associated phospholipid phosphatase
MVKPAALAMVFALPAFAQLAPPAGNFGKRLWTNTKGLVSSDNLMPLFVGVTATGTSTIFDTRVQEYFGGERRAAWVGNTGNVLGNPVLIGATVGSLFFVSYRTKHDRFRAMSFDLAQGVVLDSLILIGIKEATGRDRPDGSNDLAFPSGHASSTTMAATVISHYYPKAAIPAYLAAGFTAFSRIERNKHWLSDVVGGVTQGYIIGSTVVRRKTPFQVGRVTWMPTFSRSGVGVVASVRLP